MGARWCLLVASAWLAGCSFEVTHDGTGYRCDSQHQCPDGFECVVGVCGGSGPGDDDAATPSDDASDTGDLGLVAHYTMDDDPSGGTGLDATGHHPATCEKCPGEVSGHVGGAWRFDGLEEYVRVADDDAFHLSEGTISLWVRFRVTGDFSFFGKPVGEEGINSFLIFTDVALTMLLETENTFLSGDAVGTGAWVHVVATWSNGGAHRTLLVGPDSSHSADGGQAISYDLQDILIGVDEDPDGFINYLDGDLDDVRVYDRVLSGDEIEALPGS